MTVEPRSLLTSSSLVAGALALQLLFRVISLFVLALVLGPSGQGTVALGYLVATLGAGLASVGLEAALLRSAAIPASRESARTAVWTQTTLAVGGCLVVLAIAFSTTVSSVAPSLAIAAVPGLLFTRLAASYALGVGKERAFGVLSIAPWGANAGAITLLAAGDQLTSRSALLALSIVATSTAVAAAFGIRAWLRPGIEWAPWRNDAYGIGIRLYPGMLTQLANYRLDQLVIAALLPRADLGYYTLAVAASEAGLLPAQAVANAVIPQASGGYGPGRHPGRFMRAAAVSAALVLLVVPGFVVVVEVFLPEYQEALLPFFLLVPGAAALAASKVLAAVLVGRGDAWRTSRISFATVGVTLSATLVLIPALGLAGAAAASSLAYGVSATLLLRAVRQPSRMAASHPVEVVDFELEQGRR